MSIWWEKKKKKKRERESELIVLAVCLVIWFSPIFRLLSLVVVTDAVSGLATAIFTFNTPLLPLWYIRVWAWHTNKASVYVIPWFTKSSNVSAYEISHSQIAPEKHTMAVPAPNKWPTLHINTHLHAGKFPGSFIVSIAGSDAFHFKYDVALVQFLENAASFFFLHSLRGSLRQHRWMVTG